MAVTGLSSAYGNVYESRYASSEKKVTEKREAEQASWKALGARGVNKQWIYGENGNCGGSSSMYVTNSNSSSGSSVQDKKIEKRTRKKFAPRKHYEKRKYLREQFEEKQARKALIRGQLQERREEKEIHESLQGNGAFSRKRKAFRARKRYEASILKL